jgi:dihydrofolate reductase
MIISMIVAMTPGLVIGNNGHLPWHIGSDLKRFKRITSGHHVLMGRVNYEDIGRPLPDRINLILTRDTNFKAEGCTTVASVEEAIKIAEDAGETELFVIGGASAYRAAMPYADRLFLTIVCAKVEGTVKFPQECWTTEWKQVGNYSGTHRYERPIVGPESRDDFNTMYCTFVKDSYFDKTGLEPNFLPSYVPDFQDFYATAMMNMEPMPMAHRLKDF